MSLKENSVLMTAESEELDYEEDDANSPVKERVLEKADLEEGEISDTNDKDCLKKHSCYFFQRGKCRLGDKCPGLHVTDCLYKMIDSPPTISPEFQNGYHGANPHTNSANLLGNVVNPSAAFLYPFKNADSTANSSSLVNYEQCEPVLTEWDRALVEAKKLVKQFDKQTNRTCPPVTITIESDDERQPSGKSTKKPRRYQSPSSNSSLCDNVKKLTKQKLVDNKSDWHRANKWHDPWRRSPVHATKSFQRSANSKVRNSRSPRRRKTDYVSVSEKRHSKNIGDRKKGTARHSLSSSSTSPRPKEESPKPVQKENVSPSIEVTELKPSISKQEAPDTAKQSQKTNSHRSSSSSSRASIHRSIKENLKVIQEKKTSAVVNKLHGNLKFNISDRRPRKIAENWHRTVFRRSSSSSPSGHRSIKENFKTTQEKKTTSIENKRDKNFKLFDRRPLKIAENEHKATSHRSSTSSSPPSVYRSREKWSKRKTKPQASKQQKKVSPAVQHRISKSNELLKEKFPSFSFTSKCRSNDVGQWTPKKVRPPAPKVKSCSDMSISPLTDSSLSDIFDPDKKENRDGTHQHEVSRSLSIQPRKKCQTEVYGPICPPKNQIIAPSILETKSNEIQNNKFAITNVSGTTKDVSSSLASATKNETVGVSKLKQVKKRKFSRNLEGDLFKFHREPIFPDDVQQEPAKQPQPNDVQQKSTEMEANKAPKNDQSQKVPEIQHTQIKRETSLTRRNPRTRKEEILQQLEAINAAIERKKTTMYALRK